MSRATRLVAGITMGLLMTVAGQAAEKKIKQADLPPAVLRAVEAQTQNAGDTVTGYTKDTVEGETLYKASLLVGGHARVVTIATDGSVASVENEIEWEAVPADIQTTLTKAAGKGKLSDFRSVSKDGEIVSYNALLTTNNNRDRVSVKPRPAGAGAPPPASPANEKK